MIRLAYLCGEYPRATDTFVQREVTGLRGTGFHIETVSVRRPKSNECGSQEQQDERERTHYLLPCSPWRLLADHVSLLASGPLRYVRALWLAITVRAPGLRALLYQLFYFAEAGLLAGLMRRLELKHVHNHSPTSSGYVAFLAKHLAGLTYSMTLHGFGIFSEPARWRLKEKIQDSLFTICVSAHARSQAMLCSSRSFWHTIHVVHCGLDLRRIPLREHAGPGRHILFVGRFDHVKALPILLDAFALLSRSDPDLRLHLVGDGPQRQALELITRQYGLGDRITFYGYRSQQQLYAHYAMADVFVMTSLAEGIPLVLVEAMAFGIPVVAPCITGIPELVKDDVNGYLVTPGDVTAFADRIRALLRDASLRNRFAKEARKTVEHRFNLPTQLTQLRHVCEAKLTGCSARPARVPTQYPRQIHTDSSTTIKGVDGGKRDD